MTDYETETFLMCRTALTSLPKMTRYGGGSRGVGVCQTGNFKKVQYISKKYKHSGVKIFKLCDMSGYIYMYIHLLREGSGM
jgi:hypothetical protein